MDYEHKAKVVADCLLSYKRDESGWKVCKKSVNMSLFYSRTWCMLDDKSDDRQV